MVTKVTVPDIVDKVTSGEGAAKLINDTKRAVNQLEESKEDLLPIPEVNGVVLVSDSEGGKTWEEIVQKIDESLGDTLWREGQGIPDVPRDGRVYGRSDGKWSEIEETYELTEEDLSEETSTKGLISGEQLSKFKSESTVGEGKFNIRVDLPELGINSTENSLREEVGKVCGVTAPEVSLFTQYDSLIPVNTYFEVESGVNDGTTGFMMFLTSSPDGIAGVTTGAESACIVGITVSAIAGGVIAGSEFEENYGNWDEVDSKFGIEYTPSGIYVHKNDTRTLVHDVYTGEDLYLSISKVGDTTFTLDAEPDTPTTTSLATEVTSLGFGNPLSGEPSSTYILQAFDVTYDTYAKGLVGGKALAEVPSVTNSLVFTEETYTITSADCTGASTLIFHLTGSLVRSLILPNEDDVPEFATVNEIIVVCEGGIKFQSSTTGGSSNLVMNGEEYLELGGVLRVLRSFTNSALSSLWQVQKPAENLDTSTLDLKYVADQREVVWTGNMKAPKINFGTLSQVEKAVGRYLVESSLSGYSGIVTVFQSNNGSTSLASTCELKHKINSDGSLKNYYYVTASGTTNSLTFKSFIHTEASGSNSEFAIKSIHKL